MGLRAPPELGLSRSIRYRTQVPREVPSLGKGRREGPARCSGTEELKRSRRMREANSGQCHPGSWAARDPGSWAAWGEPSLGTLGTAHHPVHPLSEGKKGLTPWKVT